MKKNFSHLFLVYLSVIILIAANTNSYAAGSSPFPAPEETDTSFMTDSSAKLDRYWFRDSSPITFDIEIERYVGELNGDGTLADIQSLIDNKIVSETATLRMPVYDVDDDYTGSYYVREIDTVYFNGHFVGYLSGGNGNWKQNSFTIRTEWIKFPAKGSNGNAPSPAVNEVSINIDTGNGGTLVWAVEIDWAELSFEAMPPIVLIHGNGSNGGFWERRGFTAELENQKIPYDNSITLSVSESDNGIDSTQTSNYISSNSALIRSKLPAIVKEFGTKKVHLAAHSKGGLDTRDYLAHYYNPDDFKVVSFTTVSTPHQGSAGADIIRDMHDISYWLLDLADVSSLENILARQLDYNNGTKNLTTSFCAGFNASNTGSLPTDIIYQSISADADASGNSSMERVEYIEMIEEDAAGGGTLNKIDQATVPIVVMGFPVQIPVGQAGVDIIMQTMYDFLGNVKSTAVQTTTFLGVPVLQRIQKDPTAVFQPNDLMVTANNARQTKFTEIGSLKKNHASVANEDAAKIIIQKMKALQ